MSNEWKNEYVERVPGRCGGRPVVRDTRIETRVLAALFSSGSSVEEIAQMYGLDHDVALFAVGFGLGDADAPEERAPGPATQFETTNFEPQARSTEAPNTIWKYKLVLGSIFTISLPMSAHVVHVAVQDDEPWMWVLVPAMAPREHRRFRVFATGDHFDRYQWPYLGTFELPNGYVGHLCEEGTA